MRNIIQKAIFCLLLSLWSVSGKTQKDTIATAYYKTFEDINQLLEQHIPFTFEQVCFVTENTYFLNKLDFLKFDEKIQALRSLAEQWMKANPLKNYRYADSINFHKNLAIYKVLKDSLPIIMKDSTKYLHLPYQYDFSDYTGAMEWSDMFVVKLLASHKGNCHSLPYLYKILADEMGATCWLSLAPNHAYIKNRCKEFGWYNTELTSGTFPIDAWIMASGYLPLKAIQNAIYMDTLSNQQAIALCVLDLAKGYEHKTHNYTDGFILKCCDLSLKYFPKNVQAMLLKAETLKKTYEKQHLAKDAVAKTTYADMEQLYMKLFDLGYREMPDKMYLEWLHSVISEREKYQNNKIPHS